MDMQFPGQFIHGFLCWVISGCPKSCPQNSLPELVSLSECDEEGEHTEGIIFTSITIRWIPGTDRFAFLDYII